MKRLEHDFAESLAAARARGLNDDAVRRIVLEALSPPKKPLRELTEDEDIRVMKATELVLEHIDSYTSATSVVTKEEQIAFYNEIASSCTAAADVIERELHRAIDEVEDG